MVAGVRFTVLEVAEKLSVERETARGLIRFLAEVGLAEVAGERDPPSGQGAAQKLYRFKDGYEKALSAMLVRAKLN